MKKQPQEKRQVACSDANLGQTEAKLQRLDQAYRQKKAFAASLLKSVPAIAGAIIWTNAMADSLFAQAKLTHEAAKYQDQPKDGQQCSGCVQFVAPASYKVGGGSDRCERWRPMPLSTQT